MNTGISKVNFYHCWTTYGNSMNFADNSRSSGQTRVNFIDGCDVTLVTNHSISALVRITIGIQEF